MNADLLPDLPADLFKIIFEKSPGSLLVKSDMPRFTIVAASDTYLEVTASTRADIVGKGFFESFPEDKALDDDKNARIVFEKVVAGKQKIDVPAYRFDVYDKAANTYAVRHWSCCNTPIFNDQNDVAFILNTVVDITAEVKAKEAAVENENRLLLATEAAAMATWDMGLHDQSFVSSPRLSEMFGHPAGHILPRDALKIQVDEDDLNNVVIPAYHAAMQTGKYLYEVKVYWPNGALRWIKTQGIVIYDDNNVPQRMLGTVIDITDSKRDEIRKNDFIAMASHELKTPLTSVKAYLQILSKKLAAANDSVVANALDRASNQVSKMSDLIHGFLDLSKYESGKLQLKLTTFDIVKLISETITEVSFLSPGHQVTFKPGEELMVHADEEKIGQVVSNFLNNAFKYSGKESAIAIRAEKLPEGVKVAITDKGIGIKPEDQDKLFRRFYRVESDKMKNISGFGIGLYLSSEIINRHKGTIGVESEEGRGATFYFTLPV